MTLLAMLLFLSISMFLIKTKAESEFSNEAVISIKSLSEDFVYNGFEKTVQREIFLDNNHRGKRSPNTIYNNYSAAVFLNLPYAEPLSMRNAFKNAVPVSTETYNSLKVNREFRKFGYVCPQDLEYANRYTSVLGMDIDCLNLNVFAPPLTKTGAKYPVYVLLHGGNFVRGSSIDFGIDGLISNFVAEGIVVVTVNYRLGAYGFFNKPKEVEGRSTRGFYDQLLSLEWVQKNIANFGGNKSDVTLGGYGSGASSASMLAHYQIEKDKTLFHKMILHSGTADTGRTSGIVDHEFERKLKARLGCTNNNTDKQQKCLREQCQADVIKATKELAPYGIEFSVPDGVFKSPAEYSTNPTDPKHQLKILYGINRDEFYRFEQEVREEYSKLNNPANFTAYDLVKKTFIWMLKPHHVPYNRYSESVANKTKETNELLSKVLEHYFGKPGSRISKHSLTELFTDFIFTTNIVEEAKRFTSTGHEVWIYKFSYAGKLENQYGTNVVHGADVNYAYMNLEDWQKIVNEKTSPNDAKLEVHVSRNLAKTLTNFIKGQNFNMQPFSADKLNYFEVKQENVDFVDKPIIDPKLLTLWEQVSASLRRLKQAIDKHVTTTTQAPQANNSQLLAEYFNLKSFAAARDYYQYKDYNYRDFDYYNYDYKNYPNDSSNGAKSRLNTPAQRPVVRVGSSLVYTLNAFAKAYKALITGS